MRFAKQADVKKKKKKALKKVLEICAFAIFKVNVCGKICFHVQLPLNEIVHYYKTITRNHFWTDVKKTMLFSEKDK